MSDPARCYILIRSRPPGRSINGAVPLAGPVESVRRAAELREELYPGRRLVDVVAWADGHVEPLNTKERAEMTRAVHELKGGAR